jgi:hypothetical protein
MLVPGPRLLDADADECLCLTGVPDTKPWLDLLKLFAFGTYAEYKANNANLPQLDDAQALKLKQLTIVSLAAETKVIPYDTLLTSLDLSDTRTLEDCIIEGMYAGLFSGKLDQKTKEFHVTETAGRDVKPGEISDMISVLKAWVEVRAFCHCQCVAFCFDLFYATCFHGVVANFGLCFTRRFLADCGLVAGCRGHVGKDSRQNCVRRNGAGGGGRARKRASGESGRAEKEHLRGHGYGARCRS